MSNLGTVEDTLFVPMVGRIYASQYCKRVLFDEAALSLKDKLPEGIVETSFQRQSEYQLLASASRSANMDRLIRDFLLRKPDGVIIQLGCGLETTFSRCDNGHTKWYGIDLPNVIAYRKTLLPESEREIYISGDAFSEEWLQQIRRENGNAPLLITASGLFYYFEEETILKLFKMLQGNGDIEVIFDAVNKSGMTMMKKKHMKDVGHADARVFFYVDSAEEFAKKVGGKISVLAEERYYHQIDKHQLKLGTKLSMLFSDWLKMVKMIHLQLS